MNIKKFSALAVAIALSGAIAGCQTHMTNSDHPQAGHTTVQKDLKTTLQAYTWSYQPKQTNKPITLSFQNDRLGIHAGCNGMGTDFTLSGHTLKTGNIVGTLMACAPDIMKQEQFAAGLFQNKQNKLRLEHQDSKQPVLIVEASNGEHYRFIGQETAETKYQGQAEIIFLEISPETKPCVGVAPQQCLQVREIQYDANGIKKSTGEWQNFYGQIEGFTPQPKQRVILRTKRFTLKQPAADQSKYAYVQDMVVEQEIIR